MHADPIEHAAQHGDELDAREAAYARRDVARAAYVAETVRTLTQSIRLVPATALSVAGTANGIEHAYPVAEAVSDTVQSGDSLVALVAVLQFSHCPGVAVLRSTIANEWIGRNADEVAELRDGVWA